MYEYEILPQLIYFILWAILTIIPSIRLLRRTGNHVALAAINAIPYFGTVILIWIVAYSKWPRVQAV
jgi:hypothetical protein